MPREPSGIEGGSGREVLEGKARVIMKNGRDITQNFLEGAKKALKIARIFNINKAILKQRSPSCGYGKTYDGSFSGKLVEGNGVTAALLERNGIKVITEEEL